MTFIRAFACLAASVISTAGLGQPAVSSAHTKSGLSWNRNGPGVRPFIMNAPRTAQAMKVPPDRQPLARFIARVSQLAAGAPWLQFVLEVNPVKWGSEETTAVDGLLVITEP